MLVAGAIDELRDLLQRWFGKRWSTSWEARLDEMSETHVGVLLIDLLDWMEHVADNSNSTEPRQSGEIFPAVVAQDGQEWRWLTAALFADRVLVELGSLVPSTPRSYREQCRTYLRSFTQLIGPAASGHLIASNQWWPVSARWRFEGLKREVPRFRRAIEEIDQQQHPTDHDLDEALFLYDAAAIMSVERACLVPSTEAGAALAGFLATRIRRIYGASAERDAAHRRTGPELRCDLRPSLWDQLAIGSLPKLTSLDASLFADLVSQPTFEHFRNELRGVISHVNDAPTPNQLSERMAEAKRQLRSEARAAFRHVEQLSGSKWKGLAWQAGGGGLLTALGFVTAGPIEAVAAALAGSAVSALVSAMTIDPDKALSGSELVLWRLSERQA
jgi:hypothetical protein